MTALSGEAALFIPGHECDFPVAPSGFDRLVSGYRLIYMGIPHYWGTPTVERIGSEIPPSCQAVLTALYRDTAFGVRAPIEVALFV